MQLSAAPPIPSSASLAHLAKSPASAALLADFFAHERQRAPSQQQHQVATSGAGQSSRTLDGAFALDRYHSLDEIYAYLDQLARRYKHVQVFTIGRTAESRPIKALELTNNATDSDFVWLDALTHAREWITGSTLLYVLDALVAGEPASRGVAGRSALHSKNYIVVPVVNPDGYAYTWTSNRMWRKNRSRSPGSKCIGVSSLAVSLGPATLCRQLTERAYTPPAASSRIRPQADLNRNFDHSFGAEGSSADPCSHIYSGGYPFSEPETRALADLLWSLKDRIKFYLTIHSYNQLWACPYAHTTEPSKSLAKHMRVLRSIQKAVFDAEGAQYEVGPLSTSLYVGSGFGIDFAYDKCNIEHSYLVELRDKGANGFILPPDQILPTGRETLAGLRAGLKVVFGGH